MNAPRLPQEEIIDRIRRLAEIDEQIVAAMLYGSFAQGEGDRFSDVDCILFIQDEVAGQFECREWLSQIRPLALFYRNEFGNFATVFDNLIRAEFHFYPAGEMPQKIESWQGNVTLPSLNATILVDKTGRLAHYLQPLIGPPPGRDTVGEVQFLANSFLNWTLFGVNVLARGEFARAAEILQLVQDNLLRMVRILEGVTHHWMTPTRAAEQELSTAAYTRFVACTAPVNREALWSAYHAAWEWGRAMLATLLERHHLDRPDTLLTDLDAYIQNLQNELR